MRSSPTFSHLRRLIPRQVHSGHLQDMVIAASTRCAIRNRIGVLGQLQQLLQTLEADVALRDAPHDVREGPDGELKTGKHRQNSEGLWGSEEVTRCP